VTSAKTRSPAPFATGSRLVLPGLTSSPNLARRLLGDQLVELVVELREAEVMTAPVDHRFGAGLVKQSLSSVGPGGR